VRALARLAGPSAPARVAEFLRDEEPGVVAAAIEASLRAAASNQEPVAPGDEDASVYAARARLGRTRHFSKEALMKKEMSFGVIVGNRGFFPMNWPRPAAKK
jgi:hypothetical protein